MGVTDGRGTLDPPGPLDRSAEFAAAVESRIGHRSECMVNACELSFGHDARATQVPNDACVIL
jgi:hypothetical protein